MYMVTPSRTKTVSAAPACGLQLFLKRFFLEIDRDPA